MRLRSAGSFSRLNPSPRQNNIGGCVVQVTGRFVSDQQGRIVGQSAGDRCGPQPGAGGFHGSSKAEAGEFARQKLDAIKAETKAELIVVSCITCLMHLDNVQKELSNGEQTYSLPVFDYNQLLALCMGFPPKEVADDLGPAAEPRGSVHHLLVPGGGEAVHLLVVPEKPKVRVVGGDGIEAAEHLVGVGHPRLVDEHQAGAPGGPVVDHA